MFFLAPSTWNYWIQGIFSKEFNPRYWSQGSKPDRITISAWVSLLRLLQDLQLLIIIELLAKLSEKACAARKEPFLFVALEKSLIQLFFLRLSILGAWKVIQDGLATVNLVHKSVDLGMRRKASLRSIPLSKLGTRLHHGLPPEHQRERSWGGTASGPP